MDQTTLLNQIRQRKTLDLAFEYACYDRMHTDHYVNLFEIEYARDHKSLILDEMEMELMCVPFEIKNSSELRSL